MAARRRTSARAAAVPVRRADVLALAPSATSVLVGLGLFLLGLGGYVGARSTSVFAVRTVDVRGGAPALRAQVRAALRDEVGKSLLRVDAASLDRRLASLAGVHSFTFDRSFPHALRLAVRPERPVLVLRRADQAFLVAATGRVLRPLPHPRQSRLPRLWVKRDVDVVVGRRLPETVADAATVLAALREAPLPGGVEAVTGGKRTLALSLASGLEIRLGDAGDLRLKLAIARRILRSAAASGAGAGYLDVSVPERPVLSTNPRVEG